MPSEGKPAVPQSVLDLVERFGRNRDAYKAGNYNETQVRREFLDPFFKALGWDIDNERGYAEAYKDVVHEDAIKVGEATKAPDYCFRIGGARKFFLEAKKPAVDIKDDASPAFQLRRYAWTTKLPLSILTDFEELAVYDCRVKPDQKDKASVARTLLIPYTEYASRWDEIASVFSRDAVLKGSFDKYAEENKAKRGTAVVDDAFLQTIETWRKELAENLALRNKKLTQRELNFAVQLTIDRIIFLRICEGRGIEDYGKLQALAREDGIYPRLGQLFEQADDRYNSGLFHFKPEKGRHEKPDEFTLDLDLDDKLLRGILKSLYYPESPYVFSALPADVLGQVYEQFLGKVIRLTEGHHAKVDDKPEVKKAGGVYYTPTYIVEYIVQNTVGKLLEGKISKQAAKLKILDPACGSGSFLLGAYECLLKWHLDFYTKNEPRKWAKGSKPTLVQVSGGGWKLTIAERKRILLDNIYGVDIDAQAVETTKLSLLLKVLEGETQQSLQTVLRGFQERALPDLGDNIKCGNSLIGPDFYQQQLLPLDEEERDRINMFPWHTEFLEIFKAGGFDAVIGNPPYIFTRNRRIDEHQKRYFYSTYKHQSAQLNTFGVFVERCYALLRKGGMLGFITPNNWLTIDTFAPLRQFILEQTSHLTLVNIRDKVFQAANVDTAIVHFAKEKPTALTVAEMAYGNVNFKREVAFAEITPPSFIIQIGRFKDSKSQGFLHKIERRSEPLSKFCTVSTGLKAYQTGKGKPRQKDAQKQGRVFHARRKLDATYGKYLEGVDVARYCLGWSGEYLSYGDGLAEPRRSVPFNGERLLIRQIPSKPPYLVHAVFTDQPFYNDINSMVIFGPSGETSLKYLLGIINSRLISHWFQRTFDKLQRKIFPQFKVKELALFPIRPINFSDRADKSRHDHIVKLVEEMLDLHGSLAAAKTPQEKTSLERQIAATDTQIDRLVYDLYGLTADEIQIVEGGVRQVGAGV